MFENWNCIVITCPTLSSVVSTEKEIDYLRKKGRIPNSVCVLTVEDPATNIGSGAATLNALLIATEFLSVKQNLTVVSADVLGEARILILHNGRDYLYSCTGKAFISLPLEYKPTDKNSLKYASGIVSNLESALTLVDQLSQGSPYGVWVCSTDMTILQEQENFDIDWEIAADVYMFCIPSDVKYATGHGVVAIDDQGFISNIFYCGLENEIKSLAQSDKKVPLVSGIVYLSVCVAESLLSLHVQAPLDSCTYLGLDSGAEPLQVSLFFDILVAMSSEISKESFIAGKCGKTYNSKVGIDQTNAKECIIARSLVWDELSRYRMCPKILTGCQHLYWSDRNCARSHMDNLFQIAHSRKVHSIYEGGACISASPEHLIVNSFIKCSSSCVIFKKSVVYDSIFDLSSLSIGENCYLYGISIQDSISKLSIPSNLVLINAKVKNSHENNFILLFGTDEDLTCEVNISVEKSCYRPLTEFLNFLNMSSWDIWNSHVDSKQKTLMNAKLFIPNLSLEETLELFFNVQKESKEQQNYFKTAKRYSISEILSMLDFSEVFNFRRFLSSKVSLETIRNVLANNKDVPLLPYFNAACAEGWHLDVMEVLDEILCSDVNSVIKTRTLSNMADLLGAMAGSSGGLRSGPGSNRAWSSGFSLLVRGDINEGLDVLKSARANWLDRPAHIMRAARHYERATQILIQRSVNSVAQFIHLNSTSMLVLGDEAVVECPARIDLQGGWSDTPPICYELGGSVVNIAILMDGKKPVGAKACRTIEPSIVLKLGLGDLCPELVLKNLNDVLNYDQPNAQGALLKACLVCADIVDINSEMSLAEQLMTKFGGGFLVQSWSLLPQGCGMGTSSILAGAILSALWTASGKTFTKLDVIHSVLYVEQLLTTGGGWQDQVAGIMGGVNRGYSEPTLPLCIKVEAITLPQNIIDKLNSHFLLIYTGKVRLAKNLLQNVIRNWYAREESVVSCFKDLLTYSHQMKQSLLKGDLKQVGSLMNKYWEQKKILAPGCEPLIVKNLMELLKTSCFGQILVGAGGGGFMCILTKEPNAKESITSLLSNFEGYQKMTLHVVNVDCSGLEVKLL